MARYDISVKLSGTRRQRETGTAGERLKTIFVKLLETDAVQPGDIVSYTRTRKHPSTAIVIASMPEASSRLKASSLTQSVTVGDSFPPTAQSSGSASTSRMTDVQEEHA